MGGGEVTSRGKTREADEGSSPPRYPPLVVPVIDASQCPSNAPTPTITAQPPPPPPHG